MNPRLFFVALVVGGILGVAPAGAQSSGGARTGLLGGVHYGAPAKWSFALAATWRQGRTPDYLFVAGEPGIGGWRASVGYFKFTSTLGGARAGRITMLRTNHRAWRAPPQTTFVGAELQLMPAFVIGTRVGGFFRVSGEGKRRGLLTADISLML